MEKIIHVMAFIKHKLYMIQNMATIFLVALLADTTKVSLMIILYSSCCIADNTTISLFINALQQSLYYSIQVWF